MTKKRSKVVSLIAISMFLLASPGFANSQDETADRFEFHGFLTQAYASANFVDVPSGPSPTGDEVALGIPEDGTFDYRFLALQFRYKISPNDRVVVQLSSRTLGDSPVQETEDDVELDWAFYERQLPSGTSIKIGRVQIPFGIYNEIRDVGTILPFYRPPYNLYREGAFTSETVDGLAIAHTFFPESDWSLEANAYLGEWDQFEIDNTDPTNFNVVEAKDAFGFQFWLNMPILTGARLGAAWNRRDLVGSLFDLPGGSQEYDTWLFSLDMNWEKWTFRTEWSEFEPQVVTPAFNIDLTLQSRYYQLGFSPTDKIQLWAQLDVSDVESEAIFLTETEDRQIREDIGVSFNYLFKPNLVFKAEYHWVEEEVPNNVPVFTPFGVLFRPEPLTAPDGSYYIISFSVSF